MLTHRVYASRFLFLSLSPCARAQRLACAAAPPAACAPACAPACASAPLPAACGTVRAAEARLAAAPRHALPPRPDAIFLVGHAPCLAGFPPWLAASAELYHIGTLMLAAAAEAQRGGGGVAAGAARFARTAQRLGA
jgi:hypothetical protein